MVVSLPALALHPAAVAPAPARRSSYRQRGASSSPTWPPERCSLRRVCATGAASSSGAAGGEGEEEGSLAAELARVVRERRASGELSGPATPGVAGDGGPSFDGVAFAALIRSKYEGRGYDVHLIRKGESLP